MSEPPNAPRLRVDRYALYGEIASGGMATVHYGRLVGSEGFAKSVAIKRLHPQYAKDTEFSSMLLDEARIAARIQHPNVVSTLDVVASNDELFLVMEYVQGESLSRLIRRVRDNGETVPLKVVAAVVCGALHGLHAAHEATSEEGESLQIVHRDVSPQNILVGVDGVAKVLDFGVAKAIGRSQLTRDGEVKGKLAYMAPEQLRQKLVDRRADIYAAGVVLWELLTCERLFTGNDQGAIVAAVLEGNVVRPSTRAADVPPAVDAIVMRALSRRPTDRFATARQMALELEAACEGLASPAQVGEWVEGLAGGALAERAQIISDIERAPRDSAPPTASSSVPSPYVSSRSLPSRSAPATADAPGSQVSTISVSRGAAEPARARRARWGVVAAFGAGLAVAGLGFGGIALRAREPAPATPVSTGSAPVADTSASTQVAPVLSPPVSVSPPVPDPPNPTASGRIKPNPPKPPPPPQRSCVRTYADDAGVKHFVDICAKSK